MQRKNKGISFLAVLLSFLAIQAYSQVNTYSPYTRFGLGDIARAGFGQNQAAYSARDSMSVLLDFGMSAYMNDYSTNQLTNRWYNGNFHHIALSVPIGNHFAMATGIVPFSSVGYNIKQEYDGLGTGDAIDYYFKGSGGVLKYFAGLSAEAFNRISVGVNMNYLLGDITRQRFITFPKNRGFAETRSVEEIKISNIYFGFGLQYKDLILPAHGQCMRALNTRPILKHSGDTIT
jgi:hypothetical protein